MWGRKVQFDVKNIYLHGIWFTCKESKREWITWTTDLEGMDYARHPKSLEELLTGKERKAHLFLEIPIIVEKVNELMQSLSFSGDAKQCCVE